MQTDFRKQDMALSPGNNKVIHDERNDIFKSLVPLCNLWTQLTKSKNYAEVKSGDLRGQGPHRWAVCALGSVCSKDEEQTVTISGPLYKDGRKGRGLGRLGSQQEPYFEPGGLTN